MEDSSQAASITDRLAATAVVDFCCAGRQIALEFDAIPGYRSGEDSHMAGARRKIAAMSAAAALAVALMTFTEATTSGAAAAVDPDCGTSPSATYTNCLFHDSFSGGLFGTTLNSKNWRKANNYVMPTSGACLKAANVTVGGGTLNLKSEVLATAKNCVPLNANTATRFVGASVTTDTKFAATYGRIEFKARFSSNTFAHTALWMYPTDPAYGAQPKSGEIDVMERFAPPHAWGDPSTVVQTIHYEGAPGNKEWGTCTVSTPGEFHLYGVEWSPSRIKFYVDNQLCNDFDWAPTNVTAPAPFDQPFNLIATQVAGGDASTPAGNVRTTQIDWVKFWGA